MACVLLALTPFAAQAQITTGAITGVVMGSDGSALPGVTVEAVHVPTGTRYDAVTGSNGRFTIPNVRVGGPYRIGATLEGFRPFETTNVQVALGQSTDVPVTLQLAAVSEAITVTATADEVINPNRTGSTSAVSSEQIETLPTVNRTIQDFARTNAYVNVDPQDLSSTRLYVAGKNNRYNSISIDGAVNNDLFGLADTGTPGGQANALPISLDALEQIQIAVSPYDVRQGGFTGGGINVVTRNGTNNWDGSVFYSKRDPSLVGEGNSYNIYDKNGAPCTTGTTYDAASCRYRALDRSLEAREFSSDQYGGRFGGPIIKDKLFFFINGEKNKRSEQGDFSGDTTIPGNSYKNPADLATVRDFLISHFNYDPGTLGDIPQTSHSDNLFGRLDWNIANSNALTLRHNYVKAANDVISDRNRNRFRFPTSIYAFADETQSTVAQLNSTFGASLFNEGLVNLTTIRDERAVPVVFPGIEIGGSGPRNADILAGTEQFSGANGLDQDILEVTDNLTWLRGAHTITVGTHNEFFTFKNLFLSSFYGHYYFPTMADFLALNPSQYFISFATGDDPRKATSFDVAQYGLYANDQWTLGHNLTLTLGLRADKPKFADAPPENPVIFNAVGVHSSATASEQVVWSPRLGFNWQITPAQQLRGGVGSFAGRTPYVWISNSYAGTGIGVLSLTCAKPSCTPTFNPDPLNQPTSFPAGGGAFEADITDENFQLPRLLRATLGYDRELPWGIRGTAEVLWSKNQQDAYYQNLNFIPTGGGSSLDGRPMYKRASTALSQAIYLTNTNKGQQTIESLQLNKSFGRVFTLATSYTHQEATSAFDGTSATALSQWRFHHTTGDIYNPELSRSAFETEHRFNIAGTFNFNTAFLTHSIGLFYNAQSGRPYSLLFGNDVNGDTQSTNDLIFLADPNDVIIRKNAGSTWTGNEVDQYRKYLEYAGVDSFGKTLKRYDLTEPWTRQLDLHYELGLPAFAGIRTQLTGDVLNLLALVSDDYGVTKYVANQNFSPFNYTGRDAATGKIIYTERAANTLSEGSQYSVATDRSRWQARVGVRVSF
ncbi:MAG TPA: TonB-dependent receptor [Thermoanaerobaculia bacterium]|nr:TonB-dependent receptor [Thermoanaerobaculia bacterium]